MSALVLVLVEWWLAWHFHAAHPDEAGYGYLIEGIVSTPVLLAITWLLISRRPDLPVTWVFAASLLLGAVQGATGTYGHEALLGHPGLPGGVLALTVSNIAQGLAVTSTLLLLNLFPTGVPASRRWRVAIQLTFLSMVLLLVPPLFGPSPFGDTEHMRSLAGVAGLLHGAVPVGVVAGLQTLNGVVGVALVLVTVAHLIVRFRSSAGVERLQLRLFTWSVVAGIAVIALPWDPMVEAVASVTVPDWIAWSIGPAVVWSGMAMAVVRHRLYDIDRIVSRTVSWALVTLLLVGLYLGGVVVLQAALRPALGEGDLPVALSTLAAAAVARPLLTRVRALVDRRFNRARYDAVVTLDAFGRGLRDDVGLETISAALSAVTIATFRPTAVGVALAPASVERPEVEP